MPRCRSPWTSDGGTAKRTLEELRETLAGFAGCNRYFGTYTLTGTTLRFGPVGMTRMACSEGMQLEQQLSTALEATRGYTLNANQLTLVGSQGPVARFERRTQ